MRIKILMKCRNAYSNLIKFTQSIINCQIKNFSIYTADFSTCIISIENEYLLINLYDYRKHDIEAFIKKYCPTIYAYRFEYIKSAKY